METGEGHRPPHRPRRVPLIVGIAVLALVIIAAPAGCTATPDGGQPPPAIESPSSPATPTPTEPTLQPGDPVTREKLSRISAADFYWSALTRQATAPVSVVTRAQFPHPAEFEKHQRYDVTRIGVDHRTGKDVWTKSATIARTGYRDDEAEVRTRCVDGEEYELREGRDAAKWKKSASTSCDFDSVSAAVGSSDGIVPSGLSQQQAGLMIFALRNDYPGFADPLQPSLVTASGKTYIRQIVDYRPHQDDDGTYWGTKIFTWALQKTGLEPRNWPFWPGLHTRAGLHVAYYFDTSTLMPIASVVRTTPVLDDDGRVMQRYNQTVVHNYGFPEQLTPLDLEDTAPVPLIIPEGWQIPE